MVEEEHSSSAWGDSHQDWHYPEPWGSPDHPPRLFGCLSLGLSKGKVRREMEGGESKMADVDIPLAQWQLTILKMEGQTTPKVTH
jgi:hypothetical protein